MCVCCSKDSMCHDVVESLVVGLFCLKKQNISSSLHPETDSVIPVVITNLLIHLFACKNHICVSSRNLLIANST